MSHQLARSFQLGYRRATCHTTAGNQAMPTGRTAETAPASSAIQTTGQRRCMPQYTPSESNKNSDSV